MQDEYTYTYICTYVFFYIYLYIYISIYGRCSPTTSAEEEKGPLKPWYLPLCRAGALIRYYGEVTSNMPVRRVKLPLES